MKLADTISARFVGKLGDFHLDVDFEVPAEGVTAIFGPSGSGKSTLLRALAGLHHFDGARVSINGNVWQDDAICVLPHQRPVGFVFQDANLFPHLNVRQNLAFGLKRSKDTPFIDFDEVVSFLKLQDLLARRVNNLSGGERQRVAIGRALLSQPRLLLMDEPLSALDAQSRSEILPFLKRLQARFAIPMLYVTHDMLEVERLADWVVLLEGGKVVKAGPLAEVQADPDAPLSRRAEATVTLRARVCGHDEEYGLIQLEVDGGRFWAPGKSNQLSEAMRIHIMASDVSLAIEPPSKSTILNHVSARVLTTAELDDVQKLVTLGLGENGDGARVLAKVTRKSWDQLGLALDAQVFAQIKSVALADD